MNLFVQQFVTGLSIGGIYALLAVGYALIYSIFKFTNFAFGAIMMCSAYGAYYMVEHLGFTSLWAGLAGAIVFGVVISLLTEVTAYRSLRKKKAARLYLMIAAMGVNLPAKLCYCHAGCQCKVSEHQAAYRQCDHR